MINFCFDFFWTCLYKIYVCILYIIWYIDVLNLQNKKIKNLWRSSVAEQLVWRLYDTSPLKDRHLLAWLTNRPTALAALGCTPTKWTSTNMVYPFIPACTKVSGITITIFFFQYLLLLLLLDRYYKQLHLQDEFAQGNHGTSRISS